MFATQKLNFLLVCDPMKIFGIELPIDEATVTLKKHNQVPLLDKLPEIKYADTPSNNPRDVYDVVVLESQEFIDAVSSAILPHTAVINGFMIGGGGVILLRLFNVSDYPCFEHPELLVSQPIGMYHCPYCGEMCLAGMDHPVILVETVH